MRHAGFFLTLGLWLLAATVASAQARGLREVHPWGELGFGVVGGIPSGQFHDFVTEVGGVSADLAVHFDRGGAAALRIEGAYLVYGNEDRLLPLAGSGGLLAVDMNTAFYIASLRAGPQLVFGMGRVRPYAFGTAGISYFATETSLGDCCGTTNFDDTALSLAAGGGLRIDLSRGRHPASLDLGASYVRNGEVSYLREGDILSNPDGSFTLRPVRSEANLLMLQLGLSFGL
jgi:opacity protein-like surface antigen